MDLGLREVMMIDAAGKVWLSQEMGDRVVLESGVEWELVALEAP